MLNNYSIIKTNFYMVAGIRDGLREKLIKHLNINCIFKYNS